MLCNQMEEALKKRVSGQLPKRPGACCGQLVPDRNGTDFEPQTLAVRLENVFKMLLRPTASARGSLPSHHRLLLSIDSTGQDEHEHPSRLCSILGDVTRSHDGSSSMRHV